MIQKDSVGDLDARSMLQGMVRRQASLERSDFDLASLSTRS
jgi:hypothetical protein